MEEKKNVNKTNHYLKTHFLAGLFLSSVLLIAKPAALFALPLTCIAED